MKARMLLAAAAGVLVGGVASPAQADWVLVDSYSEITSQSGSGGYTNSDGCGSVSSVGSDTEFQGDDSHIGVRSYREYTWSGSNPSTGDGDWTFDVTGSIYGSTSAGGFSLYAAGGSCSAESGVASQITASCGSEWSFAGPDNNFYGPVSATATITLPAEGTELLIDVSNYANTSADSPPHSSATAISSASISISNLHRATP